MVKEKMQHKLINIFLNIIESVYKKNLTYHDRPKYLNKINTKAPYETSFNHKDKIAIVMQGPIILEENLTLETLKFYKNIFPENQLILSTWKNEEIKSIEKLKNLDIEVILNEKPSFAGIANINYQIVSTSSGIKKAKEMGYNYVLKTRTDQRIHASTAIDFCYSAIKSFPLEAKKTLQKERIIAFNLNTFMYRPFSVSDMINFGNIEDMVKYWCLELDSRSIDDLPSPSSLIEWSKQRLAEVYFLTSFLENINQDFEWTLENSWKIISEHFCILDTYDLDLYWKKYSKKEFRHINYIHSQKKQIDFSDWLIFKNNFPSKVPEDLIRLNF